MAITGIPPYTTPTEQTLRCLCGRFYLVRLAPGEDRGLDQTRDRADELGAIFIDTRSTPFMNCDCGQMLDFTSEASAFVQ